MLGTPRLATFGFRALVLVLPVSILWISVAERYNQALVALAQPLAGSASVEALGSHILVATPTIVPPLSLNGLTLHSGLVLVAVVVLAAVGIGVVPRLGWLLGLGAATFLLHVAGVVLLARGVAWASSSASPQASGQLVFSLFAVVWGLIPAALGGLWCFLYWVPRVSRRLPEAYPGRDTSPPRGTAPTYK